MTTFTTNPASNQTVKYWDDDAACLWTAVFIGNTFFFGAGHRWDVSWEDFKNAGEEKDQLPGGFHFQHSPLPPPQTHLQTTQPGLYLWRAIVFTIIL